MGTPPQPRQVTLIYATSDVTGLTTTLETTFAELVEEPTRSTCVSAGAACFDLTARDWWGNCPRTTTLRETAWLVSRDGVEVDRRRVFFVLPATVGYCSGPD